MAGVPIPTKGNKLQINGPNTKLVIVVSGIITCETSACAAGTFDGTFELTHHGAHDVLVRLAEDDASDPDPICEWGYLETPAASFVCHDVFVGPDSYFFVLVRAVPVGGYLVQIGVGTGTPGMPGEVHANLFLESDDIAAACEDTVIVDDFHSCAGRFAHSGTVTISRCN